MRETQSPLNYGDYLEFQQRANPAKRKGKRTKLRLEVAAVRALETKGFHDMRVSDVCELANVSTATFYLYFENKTEIAVAVLKEFTLHFNSTRSPEYNDKSAFAAIYNTNLAWFQLVRANAGLTRCLLQMGDKEIDFAQYYQRISYRWYRYVVNGISKHLPAGGQESPVLMLVIYGMGSMLDEISRSLIVYPNPYFQAVLDEVAPSDEELAEFLSLLWYRCIYGVDPDASDLHATCSKRMLELEKVLVKGLNAKEM